MVAYLQDNRHSEIVVYNLPGFTGKHPLFELSLRINLSTRNLDLSQDKLQGNGTAISKYKS